ncbi:MAG: TraR/DksA C4-type zinc finger protein [Bacteroidetes bacterium]|nr:TraR/DksA C4-type zinc finger protein [Bacteroidota bacterium]MBS1757804.1 TraR/DksA C4-type zinc finger protein [Bacteroidota bacterium]
MATKKPAAKKATSKKVVKQVKKASPAKKAAPKKAVKPAAKAVAKKPVAKKPAPKPVKKAIAKPVAKKVATNVKAKAVKPVAKPITKSSAKPVAAIASKKTAPVQKPITKPMAKKEETKKPVASAPAKPASPKASAKNPKDIKIIPAKPVVIPKISHKDSRKYQPDFTKSVLDELKNDPGQSIVRYNDNDLAEFKELIQRKLGSAKKELAYLQGLITRKDEMGGDESENRYMTMEDGSLSMEREQLSQMASRQITFIDHLEKALMRIENKTYGICRVTGKLIDKARLRAVPHATLSIEAKMGIAK